LQQVGLEEGKKADHLEVSQEVEKLQQIQVAKDLEVSWGVLLLGTFRLGLRLLRGGGGLRRRPGRSLGKPQSRRCQRQAPEEREDRN
jgi:hypothetical protein